MTRCLNIRASLPLACALLCTLSGFMPPALGSDDPAAGKIPGARQYVPDRKVDILNLAIDVTPNFKQRTIRASTVIQFKPIARPLTQMRLNAVNLWISNVVASAKIQAWQYDDEELVVTFAKPIAVDTATSLEIHYAAQPSRGLYFRTPEMGYKAGDTHLFTQGEAIEARYWYPSFDHPNEKFTSEITCRVPQDMIALSNGRLLSRELDSQTGLMVFRWRQDQPHVNYLISLVAGHFSKLEDQHRDVPLAFYTLPSAFNQASNSFRSTREIMAFFEKEIGVPYPWARYDQVCVNDFVAGGMENTSMTTLTDSTLFSADTENLSESEGLVAHEMAHQWFGDLVTCKDWSHLWLNEGFATYYEMLYEGARNGPDAFRSSLFHTAQGLLSRPNDGKPIFIRDFQHPDDMFMRYGALSYQKGAWVLHMLRSQLGEKLYRRCIKTYLERHRYGSVVTEDLLQVIEELSGQSMDRFFDQWIYHAHHPELDIAYAWDERAKLAKITVKQVQKTSEQVLLFQVPLKIGFHIKNERVDREIEIQLPAEDFYFKLNEAPTLVRIDPDLTLLAKINFHPPATMITIQMTNQQDVVGRFLAVEELSRRQDHEAVAQLKTALNRDGFHGIKAAAANALATIHTDEALEALLDSRNQTDARIRQAVFRALSGFYREKTLAALLAAAGTEKNPYILAEIISALGHYSQSEAQSLVRKHLQTPSFHNAVASAAIRAMRSQRDPAVVDELFNYLQKQAADFPTWEYASALESLAFLASLRDNRDSIREFLLQQVLHGKTHLKTAALNALGTLKDPKAIPALETFNKTGKSSPEYQAAQKSLSELRSNQKPVIPLQDVRNEISEIQKANASLRQELEDLKKRLQTLAPSLATNGPVKALKKNAARY